MILDRGSIGEEGESHNRSIFDKWFCQKSFVFTRIDYIYNYYWVKIKLIAEYHFLKCYCSVKENSLFSFSLFSSTMLPLHWTKVSNHALCSGNRLVLWQSFGKIFLQYGYICGEYTIHCLLHCPSHKDFKREGILPRA